MAIKKYISQQYPSFVTDAFNQYQPQFLQKLLAGQPLTPITGGEQGVIETGRQFTGDPLSNPMFKSYSGALTNLLQPSEDTARRNLEDTYRKAGAGTLQSGAFATGAEELERDIFTNRGDVITKGYSQLYPAIGNQLNNQAGLEALPRLQDEKTIQYLQSLLGAKPVVTGTLEEPTTGESIAEFLSGPLAAILGGQSGSLAGNIGSAIGGALGLGGAASPVAAIVSTLVKSGIPQATAQEIAQKMFLSGIDQKIGGTPGELTPPPGDLESILGGGTPSDTSFDWGAGQEFDSGIGGSLGDLSGLGNYANFDFSTLGDSGSWSFANDAANLGDWGFDLSNFSNASGDLGAAAGAGLEASEGGLSSVGGLGGLGGLLGVVGGVAGLASGNLGPAGGIGLAAGVAQIGSQLAGVGSALGGVLGSIASVLGPIGLLVGFGTMMASIFSNKPNRSEMARESIRDNLQPIFGKHGLIKPNKNWEEAGEAGVPMTAENRPYIGAAAVAGELIGGEKDNGRAMNMLWNSLLSLNASPDQIKGVLRDVTGSFEGGFSKWSREFIDGTLEGPRASNLAFWLGTPNQAQGKNQYDFSEQDYQGLYREGVEGLMRLYDMNPNQMSPVIDRIIAERNNKLANAPTPEQRAEKEQTDEAARIARQEEEEILRMAAFQDSLTNG